MISPWTDEKTDQLKRLWQEGHTCSRIGAQLGVTRNSVIGRVHRLGLPLRGITQAELLKRELNRQKRKASQLAQQRDRRKARGEKPMQDLPPAPEPFLGSLNLPFVDLLDHSLKAPNQCRFIAGEAAGRDTLYCGNETLPGESWCANCKNIIYYRPINLSEEVRAQRRAHGLKVLVPNVDMRETVNMVEVA